jgi:hypothetical protein
MCTFTTVGVYNDLTAGQPGIAVRTTDHKFAGRIDMILDLIVEQVGVFLIF